MILFSVFLITFPRSQATDPVFTIKVGNDVDDDYPTIQQAIDAAVEGGAITKIRVSPGTYNENIRANKSGIEIIGENKENTIIEGSGIGNTVTITNNNVTITGFTIKKGQKIDWIEGGYIYQASGIKIISNYSHIYGNIITNNTYGVYVENGYNNLIESNQIIDNGKGIRLSGTDNEISKNNISDNNRNYTLNISSLEEENFGIYFLAANNNTITENHISNHAGKGLFITLLSRDNSIYKNSFINNAVNAFDDSNNSWDDGEKFGNYWSDYTGKDDNENKIGDTAYLIPGGTNKDNYPLMEPYTEFTIDEESVVYMLILGTIIAVIFLIPIAIYWWKNFHKKID